MFISQKCSKYCNLSRFHINSFFIFFGVSYLSTAKGPDYNFLTKKLPINESEKSQIIKKGKISDRVLENLLLDVDDNDKDSDNRDSDENSENDEKTMTMRKSTLRHQILILIS